MTELMLRPSSEAVPYNPSEHDGDIVQGEVVSTETLEDMYNAEPTASEQDVHEDTRGELSPTGSLLLRAATRINNFLERRAIKKAHGEALKENRSRATEAQTDAFASYEDNIQTTADRETAEAQEDADWDTAHRMNEKFDARTARQERMEAAKDRVRGAGRAALEFTIGAGVLGAEYAVNTAKSGAETLSAGAQAGMNKAEELASKAGAQMEAGVDASIAAMTNALETGKQKIASGRETLSDMIASVRERLVRRKEAALTRKYERHARRMQRREAWKQYKSDVKDGFVETKDAVKDAAKEKVEKTKWNARAARTAGRAALLTFHETRDALKQ